MEYLHITSPAFREMSALPVKYSRTGANINPPLDIERIPETARTLVVLLLDADGLLPDRVHWMAWNIPAIRHIREDRAMEYEGRNDFGENRYTGPILPYGIHRYRFRVYALDGVLKLPPGSSLTDLTRAMMGHIVASGELTGIFNGTHVLKARCGVAGAA